MTSWFNCGRLFESFIFGIEYELGVLNLAPSWGVFGLRLMSLGFVRRFSFTWLRDDFKRKLRGGGRRRPTASYHYKSLKSTQISIDFDTGRKSTCQNETFWNLSHFCSCSRWTRIEFEILQNATNWIKSQRFKTNKKVNRLVPFLLSWTSCFHDMFYSHFDIFIE